MKKGKSRIIRGFATTLFVIIILLIITNCVFAITGSIGNARMILRASVGESIEKYVLVKNVNNVSVNIDAYADGDLKDFINIKENKFQLDAGGEKKVYFTIKAVKEGTTESKIQITFAPENEKNGIGLTSTIILIATKGNETSSDNSYSKEINFLDTKTISVIITIVIIFILIILFIIYKAKNNEKIKEKIKPKKSAVNE